MNNIANYFKPTRQQDVPHVSAVNDVNAVSSQSHKLGAMKKQTSGKTGLNDNIEHFNIEPTRQCTTTQEDKSHILRHHHQTLCNGH